MQNVSWVLLADATKAQIYSINKADPHIHLIKSIEHPQGKMKRGELYSDSPGHTDRNLVHEHSSFREIEYEAFAKKIATHLEDGRVHQHYQHLIVIAAPHFEGIIEKTLNHHIRQLISHKIHKNYISMNKHELQQKLQASRVEWHI